MIASTEQIVRSIRNCGEQLVKDAEQIAGNFYAPLCLDIRISLDLEQRATPTINVDYEYNPGSLPERPQKRILYARETCSRLQFCCDLRGRPGDRRTYVICPYNDVGKARYTRTVLFCAHFS